MTEEQGGITPSQPTGGYAPETSKSSRDRNPDGTIAPQQRGPRKRREKKKKEGPSKPDDDKQAPETSEDGHTVDILARGFQSETSIQCNLAAFSAPPKQNSFKRRLGARDDGTKIALLIRQARRKENALPTRESFPGIHPQASPPRMEN